MVVVAVARIVVLVKRRKPIPTPKNIKKEGAPVLEEGRWIVRRQRECVPFLGVYHHVVEVSTYPPLARVVPLFELVCQ